MRQNLLWQYLTAVYFSSGFCAYRKEGQYCFEMEVLYPLTRAR